MSQETFLICDNPSCTTATALDKADLREWIDVALTVTLDDDGHCEKLEASACSPPCVGPAAQAAHDAWVQTL